MTIRVSNGLRASLLGSFGFTAMMDYGHIDIYTGTQPDSATLAPTGDLLGAVTNDGDVFAEGTAVGALRIVQSGDGGLTKSGVWILSGSAVGVAGWWRWKWNNADDDSTSLFYPRLDGAIGESFTLADVNITPITSVEILDFHLNIME